MDLDVVRAVAGGAIVLVVAGGVALTLAVLGAMAEAVWPRWGTRVWVAFCSAPSVALRAFCLVAIAVVALLAVLCLVVVTLWRATRAFAVTYVHTYRSDRGTGRHFRGMGRVRQPAGRHRFAG